MKQAEKDLALFLDRKLAELLKDVQWRCDAMDLSHEEFLSLIFSRFMRIPAHIAAIELDEQGAVALGEYAAALVRKMRKQRKRNDVASPQ